LKGIRTYSPPVTLLVPKLLPTTPVQRHVCPALFFHVAVAVAPILRQVTERLKRDSRGEAVVRTTRAREVRRVNFMVFVVGTM
jgi:ribosomal protein L18E